MTEFEEVEKGGQRVEGRERKRDGDTKGSTNRRLEIECTDALEDAERDMAMVYVEKRKRMA